MRARSRLDLIRSVLKKYQWLIVDESVNYEIDEDADTLYINGRIAFLHDATLTFAEIVLPSAVRYRYHYGHIDGRLIFRSDNAPHHPEINSFPHHKHIPTGILESSEKRLNQIMEEIVEHFVTGE